LVADLRARPARGRAADLSAESMPGPIIPLGLYVHVPWCARKCPYCDFNSQPVRGPIDWEPYVAALLPDLDLDLHLAGARPLDSIFIGGGTPSLLPGAAIRRLLTGVRERLDWSADIEITLEANPGTADAAHFAAYREAGVNRLSIGIQSFDARQLSALGRIHGPEEAVGAVLLARRAGFDNLNLDLMFGLPRQDPASALTDVEAALGLVPEHLSYYQLTVEPNTPFERSPPALPDDEVLDEIQTGGQRLLAAAGLAQYEVSAHARPGRQCRHNLNYWEFGDYLGIGAGAHAKLTLGPARVERRWRLRDPARFLARAGTPAALAGRRMLGTSDLMFEFALNALRLRNGVSAALYEARTGLPRAGLAAPLAQARSRGLVDPDTTWLRASPFGYRFLNDLVALFLDGDAPAGGLRALAAGDSAAGRFEPGLAFTDSSVNPG